MNIFGFLCWLLCLRVILWDVEEFMFFIRILRTKNRCRLLTKKEQKCAFLFKRFLKIISHGSKSKILTEYWFHGRANHFSRSKLIRDMTNLKWIMIILSSLFRYFWLISWFQAIVKMFFLSSKNKNDYDMIYFRMVYILDTMYILH